MAKDLPYFKFYCSEWSDGDISLEDMNIQGLFINVCAYYWSNEGVLTLSKCMKKFKLVSESDFKVLIESNIIKVDSNDNIIINFLNEQLQERDRQSVINKINGSKGGRPPQNKPKDNQTETETKPNGYFSLTETKTETEPKQKAIREEEKREEEKKKEKISISERKINFRSTIEPFLQTYGKEVLNAFFLYWTEPNPANTKMRFEMQKTWSVSLRLSQWANRDKTFKIPTQQTDKPVHTPNPKKQII
jgi:hypothetical protein